MAVAVGDPVILARMPGYVVGLEAEGTDSSTFTTTETEVGTVTIDEIDGVTYIVEAGVKLRSTVSGDVVTARMRQDNVSGTLMDTADLEMVATAGNRPQQFVLRARYTASATGSKTFVVTGQRRSGTGDIIRDALSTTPQLFTVTVAL